MKILFASKNKNKFEEINKIFLDSKFEIVFKDDLDDVIEDRDTIIGNAQKKSEEIFEKYKIPVISDDSGLFVEALGDEPGVKTARYAGESASPSDNINKLLKNLEDKDNKVAFFKTVLYFYDGQNRLDTEGILSGNITTSPRGENGFGYDPIFEELSSQLTFAEMPANLKDSLSHRGKAIAKLIPELRKIFSYY